MVTTVVTTKGQIVIPSKLRRKFNIKKGTKVVIEERGDEIVMKAITPEFVKKVSGILSTKGKISHALLEERKKDRERE